MLSKWLPVSDERGSAGWHEPMGQVFELLRLVWAVDQGLQNTSKRMVASLGVTGPQRLVIRLVGRFPGISPGRLAALLRLHPSTLTGVFKRLEQRKLLVRRKDPRDGRRFILSLTERGLKLDVDAEGTVEAAVERLLEKLPAQTLSAGRELLVALAEALGDVAPPARASQPRRGSSRAGRAPRRRAG